MKVLERHEGEQLIHFWVNYTFKFMSDLEKLLEIWNSDIEMMVKKCTRAERASDGFW